ncbi:MAG: hypothetical protein ACFB2X_16260, partial [Rivularia sp. (in: cyanobacteria)]
MNKQLFITVRLLIYRVYLVTISSLVLVIGVEPYSQISLAQDSSIRQSEAKKKCEEEVKLIENIAGNFSDSVRNERIEKCVNEKLKGNSTTTGDGTTTTTGDGTNTTTGDGTNTTTGDGNRTTTGDGTNTTTGDGTN